MKGIALFFRHVVSPRAFLEFTKRLFCFANAASRREGKAPKMFCCVVKQLSRYLKNLQKLVSQAMRFPQKPFACLQHAREKYHLNMASALKTFHTKIK